MKALQVTIVDGVYKLALKDVPKPSIENPNQILVKVIAAAVNPSDIINSKGTRTLNLLSNSGLGSTCGKKS
jgi:NADPH:quinone reductase-like Zn-dependent oxidoreductase